MPNNALDKGNYITVDWTGDFIAFDGSPDDSTPGSISNSMGPTGNLVIEKAAGSERKFYMSVNPAANANFTVSVTLSVVLPGSGGVGPVTKQSTAVLDVVVPIDHRAANPPSVSAQQPLPHPA